MNIQKRIKEQGYTLAQVASQLTNQRGGKGISQGSLSTALNGNPSIDKLQEIANVIGIPLSELVSDKDSVPVNAIIRHGSTYYEAHDVDTLKAIIKKIEESE